MMRSKTKIIEDGKEPGIWGFDGSSTNQAPGDNSDCVLNPVFTCPDPMRGPGDILVLCEVLLPETMEPHPSNTRAACVAVAEKYAEHESLFGLEQEYAAALFICQSKAKKRTARIIQRCMR
jgi:glutamine synthetase